PGYFSMASASCWQTSYLLPRKTRAVWITPTMLGPRYMQNSFFTSGIMSNLPLDARQAPCADHLAGEIGSRVVGITHGFQTCLCVECKLVADDDLFQQCDAEPLHQG